MNIIGRTRFASLLFCLLSTFPTIAAGEGFVDLYGGAALSRDANVTIKELSPFLPMTNVQRSITFDPSATFGGRAGYWFEPVPWLGFALDVSSFRADGDGIEIPVYPISVLLIARWPVLTSEEFPRGRLQPYAAIGPSLFIVPEFKIDFRPAVTEKISSFALERGLDVRGGVAWQLSRHVALFTEYRFTHFNVGFKETGCLTLACALTPFASEGTRRKADTTLDTHHLLGGISFRF